MSAVNNRMYQIHQAPQCPVATELSKSLEKNLLLKHTTPDRNTTGVLSGKKKSTYSCCHSSKGR